MVGRVTVAMLALIACCSCTPSRHRQSATTSIAVPPADRRLLQRLALADPVDEPASAPSPLRSPAAAAPPFETAATQSDEQRATDCLSAAVYYEARSEPVDGQRAVAQVVLNRVRDRAFPASVCRVVYQRSAAGCQFSFACDGSTSRPIEPQAWRTAQAVARGALAGEVYAPVGSATHYHTTAVLPWWAASLARIGTIGSHIFYRWGDRLGGALSFRQAYSGHEFDPVAAAAMALPVTVEDGATTHEVGVIVHRGTVEATPMAAAAFGVRIHRGVTTAPAPDVPASDPVAS